jgi:hypothetical protein
MTSWDIGDRLTNCGLGSEQRRLNRRILLKQMKATLRQKPKLDGDMDDRIILKVTMCKDGTCTEAA